jgi:branched-chain amino acid transport system ATP-binding protein
MLRVTDVHASYGSIPALMGVDLAVGPQEIVALLGRNGVGKTTLLRSLMGILKPSAGRIAYDDENIAGLEPHQIARRGIAYVPQGRRIFPKLTVWENLLAGTRARADRRAEVPERIFSYFPVLRERRHQRGGTLSGGEQQMLAIARALCGTPRLLLLDEPSEGIQPSIVQQIAANLVKIVEEAQISVLLVEQNLDLALHVSRRCTVMEKGRIVHECSPSEFASEALQKRYLAI